MPEPEETFSDYRKITGDHNADSYEIKVETGALKSDVIVMIREGVKPQDYMTLLKEITKMLRSDLKVVMGGTWFNREDFNLNSTHF